MAYPVGMITRAVTFAAFFDADGGPLDLTVRVEPARSFIWAATGEAFLRIPVEGRADGAPITIELPVPGQTGFVDGAGNTISDWTYTATYALPASATPVPKVTFYLPDAPDPLVIAPNLSTHVDGGIVNVPYPVEGPPGPPGSSGGTATWGGITGTLTDQTDLQSALDNKQPAGSYAAAVHTHAKSEVGLGNVDNTADSAKPVSTAQQTALNLKANAASPAFTGTPTGLVKAHVGLSNVDNTADSAKPVSTAQQTALNLKANLASPALTGNPTAPTQTAGNNTTRLATTAFVTSAVAAVPGGGGGAPSAFYTMPIASGRVRVGAMMIPNSPWKFVDAGRVYFYPVYYDATFGVANIGFALRGAAAGGTAYAGLYDSSAPGGMPGVPVAQASAATDSSGWKDIDITDVTGRAAGWYWHAFMATAALDVHGGQPMMVLDAFTMEWAVRDGEWRWRGLASTAAGLTSLPSNPTVTGAEAAVVPIVGMKFV